MRGTRRLCWALAAWTGCGALASVWPAGLPVWGGLGLLLLGAVGREAIALRRLAPPTVERRTPHALAVGVANRITLRLGSAGGRTWRGEVFDHHPPTCVTDDLPRAVEVPAAGWIDLTYRLQPQQRGGTRFGRTALRVRGGLGLLERHLLVGEGREVRVYPNVQEVARFALLALTHRLDQMGIRKVQRRGEGLEFAQLREYRQGDLVRQIDWKATARRRTLISREYQDERDQRVVFLLDCGRRMRARDGALSHFDHALNALLLLTYVGLRQGDAVGLMTFSGPQRRWVPPAKGGQAMSRVLEQSYDLHSSTAPSDYAEAAERLLARLRRRALVILVTNLRDEDSAELQPALAALRRRNLVLVATLREAVLERSRAAEVLDLPSALRVAEAHRHLRARRSTHEAVRQRGALLLDVLPQDLPVALVNRYLEIKRSHQL